MCGLLCGRLWAVFCGFGCGSGFFCVGRAVPRPHTQLGNLSRSFLPCWFVKCVQHAPKKVQGACFLASKHADRRRHASSPTAHARGGRVESFSNCDIRVQAVSSLSHLVQPPDSLAADSATTQKETSCRPDNKGTRAVQRSAEQQLP